MELKLLDEAHQVIYHLYPRYRGIRLSPDVLVALLNGRLTELNVAEHNAMHNSSSHKPGLCKRCGSRKR